MGLRTCLIGLLMLMSVVAMADNEGFLPLANSLQQDSLQRDSLHKDSTATRRDVNAIIRETVRGFDRLNKTYIEPQHYEFTVMMQMTRTFESFILGSNGQSITFAPDGSTKIGPYLGWRWFFLGYTFDIKNIGFSQKGLKKELDLSIYSSQIGVDLFYRRTGNDYKVRDVRLRYDIDGSIFENMPFDGINVGMTGVNVYYIFNHGRFSYPAAFSQSTCQKISCGSWMIGTGYTENTLDLDYDKLQRAVDSRVDKEKKLRIDSGLVFNNIKYSDLSFSGGYAYNWVFAKDWLFCASGQLALAYKSTFGRAKEEDANSTGFNFRKVNLDGLGRFGMVYNNTRWYTGWSVILRTNNYHTRRFTATNLFGSMNAYIGYNFGLKKKYRRNEGLKN